MTQSPPLKLQLPSEEEEEFFVNDGRLSAAASTSNNSLAFLPEEETTPLKPDGENNISSLDGTPTVS